MQQPMKAKDLVDQLLNEAPEKQRVAIALLRKVQNAQEKATAAAVAGNPKEASKWADEASDAAEAMTMAAGKYTDDQLHQAHQLARRAHRDAGVGGNRSEYHMGKTAFHAGRIRLYNPGDHLAGLRYKSGLERRKTFRNYAR